MPTAREKREHTVSGSPALQLLQLAVAGWLAAVSPVRLQPSRLPTEMFYRSCTRC